MEKSSYTFIQMNTSAHLLRTCDELALSLKKKTTTTGYNNPFQAPLSELSPTSSCVGLNLLLINIGAAVLEGALRSMLSEKLQQDMELIGEHSKSIKGEPSYPPTVKSYEMLARYRNQVESKGGWENLKQQFSDYLGIKLNSLLKKKEMNGINCLFTLRNISAHGTSYVTPKEKLKDSDKDSYLFKWQSRTQELDTYLREVFDRDVLEALQHPAFAYHFFELIKKLVGAIDTTSVPKNAAMLLENIKNYSFGYRNEETNVVLPEYR